ncbi:MAG: BsuBI/PstI family type II restriction endonuclease [Acidobacteriota bacterium]
MISKQVEGGRASLLEHTDFFRIDVARRLDPERRGDLGQFLTPAATAHLMASMFKNQRPSMHLLDAGAGVGSLTAAWVTELCGRDQKPTEIEVTAYEIEQDFTPYLTTTLESCQRECERVGIRMKWEVLQEDFIEAGVTMLTGSLFASRRHQFTSAILNPPYRKIHSESTERHLLRGIGVETSNLYTAFLAIVIRLLEAGGELIAICPRSFCNGPYFRTFRRTFLQEMALQRIHVFESREHAFRDDEVLQENVILYAVKGGKRGKVVISSSMGPEDKHVVVREVEHDEVVRPANPDAFIYIAPDELSDRVAGLMEKFSASLSDLGLEVSTGRVVDFRAREFLRDRPAKRTSPLIYPANLSGGFVKWPLKTRKPQALVVALETHELLVPTGWYVLVKRFSAKEERRRVTAALYDPGRVKADRVGFENHLNYYHRGGRCVPKNLAKGLAAFLNSRLVDLYFRQFSGHTQVNATDLRSLKYPPLDTLERLGAQIGKKFPDQSELDGLIEKELLHMAAGPKSNEPIRAREKVEEALTVLQALGLPRGQHNERSALVLLALLGLEPGTPWSKASNSMIGVTPIMDFIAKHYGREYAPNIQETVRLQTIHQFIDAGLIVANPDLQSRPLNSPNAVYQVEAGTLRLLRTFGTKEWEKGLRTNLTSIETLKKRYARKRQMEWLPLTLAPGKKILLSPGGQNVLIKQVIEEFCPRFTPGGKPVYVGDTEKWAYFDEELLKSLGVVLDSHGKMPDVVIYHQVKGWLVLIDVVTSHGPVDAKRRNELEALFKGSKAGLVYVTAFLTRKAMMKYLDDISWETEVWVAESPSHLIHFNGERFLGPHE